MRVPSTLTARRWLSRAIGATRFAGYPSGYVSPRALNIRGEKAAFTFLFGGDFHHGESQGGTALEQLEQRGWQYGLQRLHPLLKTANLAVVNLETPLVQPRPTTLAGRKPRVHWGHPTQVPNELAAHGIRLVSLANNHVMDYGEDGLASTMESLRRRDIAWLGAGLNYEEAVRPVMITGSVGGVPFQWIVLAGFQYFPGYDALYGFYARRNCGGVGVFSGRLMARRIRALRARHPEATIMVYPHWGYDYMRQIHEQVVMARAWIDAGADLIVGHGPHVLQGVEQYRGKWIFYGIGSFMFLQREMDYARLDLPSYGMAIQVRIERKDGRWAHALRAYPLQADPVVTDDQPRLLTQEEFPEATRFLLQQSPNPDQLRSLLREERDVLGPCWALLASK